MYRFLRSGAFISKTNKMVAGNQSYHLNFDYFNYFLVLRCPLFVLFFPFLLLSLVSTI